MCGLAGIYHLNGAPIDTSQLLRMNRMIRHRGPDDEGYVLVNTITGNPKNYVHEDSIDEKKNITEFLPLVTDGNLGIAFRRLSIIDTSALGHQPMSDPSKSIWLAFNGEIYNYIEIREELLSLSHQFISGSDSEVFIHAYMQWGIDCIQKCIGMFTIVLYDHSKRKLFIVRDRVGIKPLNYYFDGKTLLWASEEKQIASSGIVSVSPNETKIGEFLRENKYFEDDDTFFNEIKQLPAAHYMTVDSGGMKISRYWDIELPQADQMMNASESVSCIRELLSDSIKIQLRSDVPLGIALSGGIDSSSVCCLAAGLTDQSIQTFSVYYEGKAFDERKYIREVLKKGRFNSTFYTASDEISFDEISKWVYQMDAPTTGASPFSAYQNYKNVRQSGIVVLLNGQGGDELFAGYPYYIKYYLADLLKTKQFKAFIQTIKGLNETQGFMQTVSHSMLSILAVSKSRSALRKLEYNKYSNRELYPEISTSDTSGQSSSLITQALYDAIKFTHLPHMLRWEDRNSMANSIESRVPFLDHRLIEKSFYIPPGLKIHKGQTKHILRQAMNNIVPDVILDRTDKIGFATPTDKWTRSILSSEIKELIQSKEFEQRPWWFGNKIRQRFDISSDHFGVNELWRIMNCEIWYRSFFK